MITIRTDRGTALVRPAKGDVLVVNAGNPDLFAVIPDPTGELGEIMRVCAAREQRRKQETR